MFKDLLKRFREQRDVTKSDLSDLVGRSLTFIINQEAGKKIPPSFDMCLKISRALNLSKDEEHELLLAAKNERFKPEDQGFFDLIGLMTLKELTRTNFSVLFNNEKSLDLLHNPKNIECLEKFDQRTDEDQDRILAIIDSIPPKKGNHP